MGLGRLNPGCKTTCNGCEGCFGSITKQFCSVEWTTIGDPIYVEVRLDGVVISTAKSGRFNDPPSGVYSLHMQCKEVDELLFINQVHVTRTPFIENCQSCCEWVGPLGDSSVRVPMRIEIQGHPVWQAFNGTYYLHRRECFFFYSPCMFEYHTCFTQGGFGAITPKVTWPLGPPGNYVVPDQAFNTCTRIPTANLYVNGFSLGQWTDQNGVTWDAYALPYQLSPRVILNNNATQGIGYSVSVDVIAQVTVFNVRVSTGGPCSSTNSAYTVLNDFFGNRTYPNAQNVLPCGSGTKTGINTPDTSEIVLYSRFPALRPYGMSVTLYPS